MTLKTITLKGTGIRKELKGGGTITPGHLVKRNSSNEVVVHSTAAGDAQRAFAVEDDIQGNGIGTNYSSGEQVQFDVFARGDEVYAWLIALSDTIVIGDYLESAGSGMLRKLAAGVPVGVALEALNISATGSVDTRIQIEVY